MLKLSQNEKQLSPQMGDFPLAYLEGKFLLDGKTYEIETFKIVFNQPIDYKNQLGRFCKRNKDVRSG